MVSQSLAIKGKQIAMSYDTSTPERLPLTVHLHPPKQNT